MDVSYTTLVGVFDRAGIIAFAFSGVEVGVRKRFDVLGLLVMGMVTATGGGVMRDLLLDRTPYLLEREDYFLLAAVASLGAVPLVSRRDRWLRWLVAVLSALGLGAFASAGAAAAIDAGHSLPAVVALAMLTATGGGVMRDLLAADVPVVLRAEVNATSAALGGIAVWAIDGLGNGLAAIAGALLTTVVRLLAAAFGLGLPIPGSRGDASSGGDGNA
jgi:uncharacterized membrane protein YeiH